MVVVTVPLDSKTDIFIMVRLIEQDQANCTFRNILLKCTQLIKYVNLSIDDTLDLPTLVFTLNLNYVFISKLFVNYLSECKQVQ